MKVKDLIALLHEFPPDLPVVYELYSEQKLLERDDLSVKKLQPARPDGWVAGKWGLTGTEELCTVEYLVLPGN
jgi:hypothetical protein